MCPRYARVNSSIPPVILRLASSAFPIFAKRSFANESTLYRANARGYFKFPLKYERIKSGWRLCRGDSTSKSIDPASESSTSRTGSLAISIMFDVAKYLAKVLHNRFRSLHANKRAPVGKSLRVEITVKTRVEI